MAITRSELALQMDADDCARLAEDILELGYSEVAVAPRGHRVNVAFREWPTSRRLSEIL